VGIEENQTWHDRPDSWVSTAQKNHTKAIENYTLVLKSDNKHTGALTGLGSTYLQLGETDSSEKYFKKSIEINSSDPYAHLMLAKLYYCTFQFDAASPLMMLVHDLDTLGYYRDSPMEYSSIMKEVLDKYNSDKNTFDHLISVCDEVWNGAGMVGAIAPNYQHIWNNKLEMYFDLFVKARKSDLKSEMTEEELDKLENNIRSHLNS